MATQFAIGTEADVGQVHLDRLCSEIAEAGAPLGIQAEQRGDVLVIAGESQADLLNLDSTIAEWWAEVAPVGIRLTFSGAEAELTINFVRPERYVDSVRSAIEIVATELPRRKYAVAKRAARIDRFRELLPRKGVKVQLQVVRVREELADLVIVGHEGPLLPRPAAMLVKLSGLPISKLTGAVFSAQAIEDPCGVTLEGMRLVHRGNPSKER